MHSNLKDQLNTNHIHIESSKRALQADHLDLSSISDKNYFREKKLYSNIIDVSPIISNTFTYTYRNRYIKYEH